MLITGSRKQNLGNWPEANKSGHPYIYIRGKRGKRKMLSRVPTDTNMNAVSVLSDTSLTYIFFIFIFFQTVH